MPEEILQFAFSGPPVEPATIEQVPLSPLEFYDVEIDAILKRITAKDDQCR